jgi:hypothetical protein
MAAMQRSLDQLADDALSVAYAWRVTEQVFERPTAQSRTAHGTLPSGFDQSR